MKRTLKIVVAVLLLLGLCTIAFAEARDPILLPLVARGPEIFIGAVERVKSAIPTPGTPLLELSFVDTGQLRIGLRRPDGPGVTLPLTQAQLRPVLRQALQISQFLNQHALLGAK